MPAVSAAACCAAATPASEVVEDLFGFLRVLSDGTILRSPAEPVFCPTTFPTSHPSVQWKEAVYDKAKNLRVRMYKPAVAAAAAGGGSGDASGNKLPVLVHFHGGGFCLGSCTWGNVHAFCLRLAADAGAVVLSAGYRLAPEHRLPAAFDDGASCMRWLRDQSVNAAEADAWLTEAADFVRIGGSPSYDRRGCRRCPERGHREQNTRDGERVLLLRMAQPLLMHCSFLILALIRSPRRVNSCTVRHGLRHPCDMHGMLTTTGSGLRTRSQRAHVCNRHAT